MIPRDDFTPHGYLDNPYRSWKLNPSGVLRSLAPLGMGWHVPNVGTYVRNQFQYMAHLPIGLKIGNTVLVTPEDFRKQGCVNGSYNMVADDGQICALHRNGVFPCGAGIQVYLSAHRRVSPRRSPSLPGPAL